MKREKSGMEKIKNNKNLLIILAVVLFLLIGIIIAVVALNMNSGEFNAFGKNLNKNSGLTVSDDDSEETEGDLFDSWDVTDDSTDKKDNNSNDKKSDSSSSNSTTGNSNGSSNNTTGNNNGGSTDNPSNGNENDPGQEGDLPAGVTQDEGMWSPLF